MAGPDPTIHAVTLRTPFKLIRNGAAWMAESITAMTTRP